MSATTIAPAASQDPYWWRAAPRQPAAARSVPKGADVVIVGSGFTGTVAALNLARAGRHVLVLDRGEPGAGASTRNAGYVGRTLKHSFGDILESEGLERAVQVYREMRQAFDCVFETVEAEGQMGIDDLSACFQNQNDPMCTGDAAAAAAFACTESHCSLVCMF